MDKCLAGILTVANAQEGALEPRRSSQAPPIDNDLFDEPGLDLADRSVAVEESATVILEIIRGLIR